MAWDCNKFYSWLFDRVPHYADDILKDWFPTDDAWIGNIKTRSWEAFTGTEHVRDRVHVGAPDTSMAWQTHDNQSVNCVNCDPPTSTVAWGSSRSTFGREWQRYQTNVLCFDEIDTKAKAREQFSEIVDGLKRITKQVQSDWARSRALMKSPTLYLAGSNMSEVSLSASSFTGAALTMNIGGSVQALVTSTLTIQYLQRFYEPLVFAGYNKSKYVPATLLKLLTDPITSQQLVQGNPTLVSTFRHSDFAKGGELFKYGLQAGIGNFGIQWDGFPARFYPTGVNGELRRVFPYANAAATIGIKPQVQSAYILAPYQISWIWHPESFVRYVPDLAQVHPEMPFLTRDLAGKWNFAGGNRDKTLVTTDPVTGTQCVQDNKAGNKGLWWADFENSLELQYPEWIRPILHQRDPGCVSNAPACSTAPAYTLQNLADINPVCSLV